ncbi:PAS domain-containing protein, partial [Yoonia sp.]|uniref:PAS domain-containing protein n=1 Tax=Yoonia sp. TaxID=2212373 RepID=UPI003F6D6B4D
MIVDTALWSSLPVPALLLDCNDVIIANNPAAEGFLNMSTKSLAGQKLWEKVMIDAPLEAPFQRARENRTSLFVNDVDVGSGERAPMLCNLQFAPLQGAENAMIVMISPREIASRIN